MSVIMNIQFSVFCNTRIEPIPENITSVLSDINSLGKYVFLPSVITGQNIDLVSRQVKNVSNLTFVTTDQSCQIVCMDNRIDLIINGNTEGSEVDLQDSLAFAKSAVKKMMDKYSIMGNRLALNVTLFSDAYDVNFADSQIGKRFFIPMDYYNGKEIVEWSTRANSRASLKVGQTNEMLNVITELATVQQPVIGEKRILCHMDLNTLPENVGFRFDPEKLNDFSIGAIEIAKSIRDNFEGLDKND